MSDDIFIFVRKFARKMVKPFIQFVEVFAMISIGLLLLAGIFYGAAQLLYWYISQTPWVMFFVFVLAVSLIGAVISVATSQEPEKKKNDD